MEQEKRTVDMPRPTMKAISSQEYSKIISNKVLGYIIYDKKIKGVVKTLEEL